MFFRKPSAHHEAENVEPLQRAGGEIRVESGGRATIHRLHAADARVQSAAASDGAPMPSTPVAGRRKVRGCQQEFLVQFEGEISEKK